MIGTSIAHYKVTAKLGAGGMGEVYRATDTKLGREVALKVLPEAFAQDAQRMQRFQREAQVLASLNHPNIATIHGLEEAGETRALVMELVEGPTLADRIAQGAVPIDEALPIAKQITDALEYAHEKGIIHRDLKPANVKVTPEGQVKVLDFGLAKALAGDAASQDISNSPTLTAAATQAGIILGTAAYMSPEQAKGKRADRRADIWSFGVVLFEMLTGGQMYAGETAAETMAAVIKDEPKWEKLPASTPPRICELLRRCLNREARHRLQAIGEARIAIEDVIAHPQAAASAETIAPVHAATPFGTRVLPWAVAGVLAVVAGWLGWQQVSRKTFTTVDPVRFSLTLQQNEHFTALEDTNTTLAISPDGNRLVYVARRGDTAQLFFRPLGQLKAIPIPGTEGARNPFFSPDGKWVAFTANGKLKRASLDGGSPLVICDSTWGGGTWGTDGTVIFTPSYAQGLWKVPAAGGEPEKLTEPNRAAGELGHWWPQRLPDGDSVLFTSWITPVEKARLVVLSLKTGKQKVVFEGGSYGRYLPTGHLIFMRSEGLMAVPFDLDRLEVRGTPVRVSEDVQVDQQDGLAHLTVSANGSLVYLPKATLEQPNEAVWVDRRGKVQPLQLPPGRYEYPSLSPDGRRLALTFVEQDAQDVWVYDLVRGTHTRVATGPTSEFNAHWTRDGKHLIYSLERTQFDIVSRAADGTGAEQTVVSNSFDKLPSSITPDGKILAYFENHPKTQRDIWTVSLEGSGKPEIFLATPFKESKPAFSPDGHWIAYQSDVSGQLEIYVQAFPGPSERWQVSIAGGTDPAWAKNGGELYFRLGGAMMAARVKTNGSFSAERPVELFRGTYDFADSGTNFDVAADGRFLMFRIPPESAPRTTVVVLNWFEELKRLVPTGK